ncbi:MAG: hypothetical protein KDH15_09705 [Rhodocyclaceae bacterium]|nr:hypothetical protein [Rhodocyclaceae bacterium]
MEQTIEPETILAIDEVCRASFPRPQHGDLLRRLGIALPGHRFEMRARRNGWFRPGGLITPTGEPITDDIQSWAEAAWKLADEDAGRLLAACHGEPAEADLRSEIGLPDRHEAPIVTRYSGVTHYFVSRYAEAPEAFIQLEVEELREVTSHRLGDGGAIDSVEDLVAPPIDDAEGRPVGTPIYRLRSIHDISRLIARVAVQGGSAPSSALRFFGDWRRSRAATVAVSAHWLLNISAWTDGYGVERIGIKPISSRAFAPTPVPPGASGVDLANELIRYDRQAGYPMAWFFDMVAGRGVPDTIARAVFEQWQAGYRYLPERDASCVADYCRRPYRC